MNERYVIATARFDKDGHYRTRYYVVCVDGEPRYGDKQDAARFVEAEARTVAAQLAALAPAKSFAVVDDSQRPPRALPGDAPRRPQQSEAFT